MKGLIETYSIVDLIAVGILLTAVSINALHRLETCVRAYFINSWLLSALVAVVAYMSGESHLYFASILTVLSKGIGIPIFLQRIIKKIRVTHDVEPYIGNTISLLVSGVLVSIVYASLSKGIAVTGYSKNALQIAVAVLVVGLFIMISRKKAITQVIGLLIMENGLFLAGFSLTAGMPLIIELGVLFDVLMAVIILGLFTVQIKKSFVSSDLDRLTTLKG